MISQYGRKLYASRDDPSDQQDDLISGNVPVAVYGLGKMGLPLAAVYADVTTAVIGVDTDEEVVETVNRGVSHVTGEPGLSEAVSRAVSEGWLRATDEGERAAEEASVHVVIVPTLVDESDDPDLSVVKDVTRTIAAGLEPGDVVIAESTLPPRTCRDVLLPLLERESGLSREEFGLAFCPERTSSGRALEDIRGAHPKIVGGVDEESTRAATLIYEQITDNDVLAVSDATTAEAVKVFEGVYRDVNIALANELGRHSSALGIDVVEAIEAANTQPFCDIHTPGAGVGGHCIPYYPYFLIGPFDEDTQLLETARAVNDEMPFYTAQLALDTLRGQGVDPADASILVLGLTYRPGVEEIRATPALPVVKRLDRSGASVFAHDPVLTDYDAFEEAGAEITETVDLDDNQFDAVVLVTPQAAFEDIDVPELGPEERPLVVVDGRQDLTHLRDRDDVTYRGVGLDG
ncbi:nucleotide sugar dehydrogenase [Halobellus captivus]|uniref:nucleotide sugar dehydrogenase n=1 Tax=Halobellus captivus TaxID=2592614 RepID=UPI00119F0DB7|nr:nucleotide sugar dehydrogenase [Halobellus captivus]